MVKKSSTTQMRVGRTLPFPPCENIVRLPNVHVEVGVEFTSGRCALRLRKSSRTHLRACRWDLLKYAGMVATIRKCLMSDWTLALLNLQPMRHSVKNAVELERLNTHLA
jgi:hypothetical protein